MPVTIRQLKAMRPSWDESFKTDGVSPVDRERRVGEHILSLQSVARTGVLGRRALPAQDRFFRLDHDVPGVRLCLVAVIHPVLSLVAVGQCPVRGRIPDFSPLIRAPSPARSGRRAAGSSRPAIPGALGRPPPSRPPNRPRGSSRWRCGRGPSSSRRTSRQPRWAVRRAPPSTGCVPPGGASCGAASGCCGATQPMRR